MRCSTLALSADLPPPSSSNSRRSCSDELTLLTLSHSHFPPLSSHLIAAEVADNFVLCMIICSALAALTFFTIVL
jgi:hypothetical protein